MEQTHTRESHCHAIFVARLYYVVVTYRAACLCNVFNTALVCTLYVVAEGVEVLRS